MVIWLIWLCFTEWGETVQSMTKLCKVYCWPISACAHYSKSTVTPFIQITWHSSQSHTQMRSTDQDIRVTVTVCSLRMSAKGEREQPNNRDDKTLHTPTLYYTLQLFLLYKYLCFHTFKRWQRIFYLPLSLFPCGVEQTVHIEHCTVCVKYCLCFPVPEALFNDSLM